MIIDTTKIEHAILHQGTAQWTASRFGLSPALVNQYRANPDAKAYRDWHRMSLETAEIIMNTILEEEKAMENKKRFEEDVEKYGKSVAYDDAVSEIYANLPDGLEIGDTQTYCLSGADKNGNSAGFDFEVVSLDEDGIPEFEYTGFNSIL